MPTAAFDAPGSARHQRDPGPAGQLAVRLGHVRRAAFLPADDQPQRFARIVQGVEHRQIAFAGNAKSQIDALGKKVGDQDLAAGAWRGHGRRHSRVPGHRMAIPAAMRVCRRAPAVVGLYNHATPGRPGQKTIATMNLAATLHEALLFAVAGGLLALVMMRWKPETRPGPDPDAEHTGHRRRRSFGAGAVRRRTRRDQRGHRAARGRAGHRDDRLHPHPAGLRLPGRAGAHVAAAHSRRRPVRAVAGRLCHLSDGRARRQSGRHCHDLDSLSAAASRFRCARLWPTCGAGSRCSSTIPTASATGCGSRVRWARWSAYAGAIRRSRPTAARR